MSYLNSVLNSIKSKAYQDELSKCSAFNPFKLAIKKKAVEAAAKKVVKSDVPDMRVLIPGQGFKKVAYAYLPTIVGAGVGAGFMAGAKMYKNYKSNKTSGKKKSLYDGVGLTALGGAIAGGTVGDSYRSLKQSINGARAHRSGSGWAGAAEGYSPKSGAVGKAFDNIIYTAKSKADAAKIYRSHAVKHHPDKGGSVDDMQDINNKWNDFKNSHRFSKLAYLKLIYGK